MLGAPARAWHVFKHIFAEPWGAVPQAHPRYQTAYYEDLVTQMLGCGNPDKMGSLAYRCPPGGQGEQRVAMRGQSSFCGRGAKGYGDHWLSQVSQVRHTGVIDRPSILTVPARFRTPCSQHAAVLGSAGMRCGAPCLDECSSTVRGKALQGGAITGLHPPGRHGPYHPHRHLLATRGGDAAHGARWEPLQDLPYALLRGQWQGHLRPRRRQPLKTDAVQRLVAGWFRKEPDGLVPNVQQGAVPSPYQSLARAVAQDVVSPPMAVRRLERSDGARVTDHDRSHRTARREHATVEGTTFIGRMVQHTRPQGCKRIRDDGVQATKTLAKVKMSIQAALAQGEGVLQGAVQIIARLP
jgi:Putative transposase